MYLERNIGWEKQYTVSKASKSLSDNICLTTTTTGQLSGPGGALDHLILYIKEVFDVGDQNKILTLIE